MKYPMLYNADNLRKWETDTEINGKWLAGRPIGLCSPVRRFYLAWLVLTGKCDVLKWGGGQ